MSTDAGRRSARHARPGTERSRRAASHLDPGERPARRPRLALPAGRDRHDRVGHDLGAALRRPAGPEVAALDATGDDDLVALGRARRRPVRPARRPGTVRAWPSSVRVVTS